MDASLHIIKSAGARNPRTFDGKPGYTLAQGQ